MASNRNGLRPAQPARRWSQTLLPQPHLIRMYKQNMEGGDRLDQNIRKLNLAGIFRMSSVTIFQPDQFVLSTIYSSNLTLRSP